MKKLSVIILTVLFLSSCKSKTNANPAGINYVPETITTTAIAETSETTAVATTAEPVVFTGQLHSRSAYMYDMNANEYVYKINENEKLPPASILKIMTCLLVLEKVPDLEQIIEVPQTAFDEFTNGDPNTDNAADAGICPGQTNLTYTDALHAMMLASGCEASNILAYNAGGGDMSRFISDMNKKAKTIGCKNTNITNAHGLYNPDNYTTAYDMFLITKYAYDNYPVFAEICAKEEYIMPANMKYPDGYKILTANAFLRRKDNPRYFEYATGVKSGSINEYYDGEGAYYDGFTTLVTIAEKDGAKFMIVTLGAPYYDDEHKRAAFNYDDHTKLYKWAFENLC